MLRTAMIGETYYEVRRVSRVTWYLSTVVDGREYLAIFHSEPEANAAFDTLTRGRVI